MPQDDEKYIMHQDPLLHRSHWAANLGAELFTLKTTLNFHYYMLF